MKLFKSIAIVIAMLMAISTVSFNQVVEVDAAAMKLNYSKKNLQVKKSFTLKVKNAKKKKIKWSSSKKKIAKVSKKGKVTGLKAGKAIITAKIGKKKLKCTVTVMTKAQFKAAKAAKNTKPVTSNNNTAKNNKTSNNKTTNNQTNKNDEALQCANAAVKEKLYTRDTMKTYLLNKKFNNEEVNYVLNTYDKGNLWSVYAEQYVRNLLKNKDYTRNEIENILHSAGFDGTYILSICDRLSDVWRAQAVKYVKEELDKKECTYKELEDFLKQKDFEKKEIEYALSNCGINWNESARKIVDDFYEKNKDCMWTRSEVKNLLKDNGFTEVIINYAVNNSIDWKEQAKVNVNLSYENSLNYMFSRRDVKEELQDEEFTTSEITYAINNCNIDWKEQAKKNINLYIDDEDVYSTRLSVKEWLQNEEFTTSEIKYAFENCNVDWREQARKNLDDFHKNNMHIIWSRIDYKEMLKNDGYSNSEIDYALEKCNLNWNDVAVQWAEELIEYDIQHYEDCFVTRENLESSLLNNGFTSSEIEYVKKNAKIEWKYEALKCLKLNLDESITKEEATNILNESGFTADEIEYALNECGIN